MTKLVSRGKRRPARAKLAAAIGFRDFFVRIVEAARGPTLFDEKIFAHADAVAFEGFARTLLVADELTAHIPVCILVAALAVRMLLAQMGTKRLDPVKADPLVALEGRRTVLLVALVTRPGREPSLGALLEADTIGAFGCLDVEHRHRRLRVIRRKLHIRNLLSHHTIPTKVGALASSDQPNS